MDSAFGSDGRFHPLAANVLPPSYGGAAIQGECVAVGRTVVVENERADRSGAELLPEEFPPEAGAREAPGPTDRRPAGARVRRAGDRTP